LGHARRFLSVGPLHLRPVDFLPLETAAFKEGKAAFVQLNSVEIIDKVVRKVLQGRAQFNVAEGTAFTKALTMSPLPKKVEVRFHFLAESG